MNGMDRNRGCGFAYGNTSIEACLGCRLFLQESPNPFPLRKSIPSLDELGAKKMTGKSNNVLERKKAIDFLNSMRGRYIIAQALEMAIEHMEEVEPPMREVSNIEDMRFLRENLFTFPVMNRKDKEAANKIFEEMMKKNKEG